MSRSSNFSSFGPFSSGRRFVFDFAKYTARCMYLHRILMIVEQFFHSEDERFDVD